MAGNTIAGDASVRKRRYRGGEGISSRVAKVTILGGRQMADGFSEDCAGGNAELTIVTTFTTNGKAWMVCGIKR